MPDLSPKAIHQFWHTYQDPTIYRVISFMEGAEEWTLDGNPDVEAAIKVLEATLENIGNIELKQEPDMVDLVSQLKTGRGLYVLMCLDMAYPGAASKVIMHAETISKTGHARANFFLVRNVIFERFRLLTRVFAEERLKLVLNSLEGGF